MPSPEEIIIRIETHIPRDSHLTFDVSSVAANDLQAALEGEDLEVSPLVEHSAPEFIQVAVEVSSVLGATLAGTMRALDKYWHRNDGKESQITFSNAEVEFDAMSTDPNVQKGHPSPAEIEPGSFIEHLRRRNEVASTRSSIGRTT